MDSIEYIDLSTPENIEKWCKYLNCEYVDVMDAVCKVGVKPEIVKMILELNRKTLLNPYGHS